jgi:hypothetical protein
VEGKTKQNKGGKRRRLLLREERKAIFLLKRGERGEGRGERGEKNKEGQGRQEEALTLKRGEEGQGLPGIQRGENLLFRLLKVSLVGFHVLFYF